MMNLNHLRLSYEELLLYDNIHALFVLLLHLKQLR